MSTPSATEASRWVHRSSNAAQLCSVRATALRLPSISTSLIWSRSSSSRHGHGCAGRPGEPLVLPLAGSRVAVVHADLVAADERAAHPCAHHDQHGAGPLEREHDGPRISARIAQQPSGREQHRRAHVGQRVVGRPLLARAFGRRAPHVVHRAGGGREQRGRDPGEREMPAGGPEGRSPERNSGDVERLRSQEEREWEGHQHGVDRMPLVAGRRSHRRAPCPGRSHVGFNFRTRGRCRTLARARRHLRSLQGC